MRENIQYQNFNNHQLAAVLHDTGSKNIVIFCHGFRSSNIGPNRFFVKIARQLAEKNISSLRFDQYGSGNSEGDFFDSSFIDWIESTKFIAKNYLDKGHQVSLLGQSMGGAVVIAVGAEISTLTSIVAWSPDPNIGNFKTPESGTSEEGEQVVQARYWQEAYNTEIANKLALVKSPTYVVQCTEDKYVNEENREAITKNARPNHIIDNMEGYPHSNWTYKQSKDIIEKTVKFLVNSFLARVP
jgi:esterase/lipase